MMYGYKGRFFDDGPVGRELKGIGALPDKGMKPTFETSGVGIRTMDDSPPSAAVAPCSLAATPPSLIAAPSSLTATPSSLTAAPFYLATAPASLTAAPFFLAAALTHLPRRRVLLAHCHALASCSCVVLLHYPTRLAIAAHMPPATLHYPCPLPQRHPCPPL
ncbi:hypothetical protein C1H76_2650 [Elsinoe australis]|uniref:Uncharacterized protein n=1 Tax=Elsinoe australis TaxID=40998 RepID=A0A4U7B9W2_9PEZI|nr:hypothetical protein C1H76_2650 [Elsinoe australis]